MLGFHAKSIRHPRAYFKASFFKKITQVVHQTHITNVVKDLKADARLHNLNTCVHHNKLFLIANMLDFPAHPK